MKRALMALFVLGFFALSGCTAPPLTETGGGAKMANPASAHCVDQGHKLEIRAETGGEVGYCIFDDGSECEEWAFFRGECAPGETGS